MSRGEDTSAPGSGVERQRFLSTLVDQMQEAVIVVDRDLRVQTWAGAAEELFGWSADEAVGRLGMELLDPQFPEGDRAEFLARLAAFEPARVLSLDRCKDGTRTPNLVTFEPLHDSSGDVTGFLIVVRDMTREWAAEQALRDSETRYRSVIAAMAEGVVVQDVDGVITTCNAAAERILGLSHSQVGGRTSTDSRWRAVHEDGSPFPGEDHPAMVTLRTGQRQSNVIMGVHRPEGRLTWISVNSEPLGDPPYAVVASFMDITEQRRRAEEMQRMALRKARLEWLEERINEIQLVIDETGAIVEVNDQALAAYGYCREELEALTIHDLRVTSPFARPDQLLALARARGGVRFDSEHRRKSGECLPVEVSCRAFRSGDETLLHCIIRDLTEHHLAEREHVLLAGLIRNMHDAVIVTDDQFRITTYTGAAKQVYGRDEDEVVGRSVYDEFQLEFPDGDGEAFDSNLRAGRHCRASVRARRKDGSWIELDMVADALRDSAGSVTGYFSVCRDISILKEAARTLRESERRLALAFAGSRDGVWDLHVPSGMAYFSERCRDLLGFGDDEPLMHISSWLDIIHADDRSRVNVAVTGFLTGCDSHIDLEYRLLDWDRQETWLQARGKIVEWDAEDHPVRAAGTLTDVSARCAAETQLKAALRENERLVGELREALDNVKTLGGLVPICAWCKKVRNDTGFWEQVEEYIVEHTEAQIRHGICPGCFSRHTPKRR